ncbi:polysaccharide deacetylase family protein [Ichthyenterobacterium sp. W332]|uniref:Polysaccharide deacetylase family protein n=1 Tax=Microcosmobacter mediterraneus TaxID=3075607 RepID=A0ABU2YNY1_9FLAO|nr:polysaccharide deacetylase family protein [Ichthyenterobacterium sp. W332]MDT0559515.1 polysaccharide deacetylase family protein [Ichthyenterobacterium sp. W332]
MSKLPILMYHNVSKNDTESIGLTISENRLNEQFEYLKANKYNTFHFSDIMLMQEKGLKLPKKSVIITFDDVYVNQLDLAYPLLKSNNLKACFYIPMAYVGGKDDWNSGKEAIMSVEQLQSMDSTIVELGLHSFYHKNYKDISLQETQEDFQKCKAFINDNNLDIKNVLAYPYGKYPKSKMVKADFFEELQHQKIAYALRIGNRINRFPFKNNYEIQRIDIKGEDSLKTFKLKLKFGKLKLF